MRSLSPAARVGVLVLLILAAIAIHETGHFLVYCFAGYPVRITLQSVRLFPCSMDLVRAVRGAPAFSDEGEIALGLTSIQSGRAGVVVVALVLSLTLT